MVGSVTDDSGGAEVLVGLARTVDLVMLCRHPLGLVAPADGGRAFDLASVEEPVKDLVEDLIGSTVRLSEIDGVASAVIDTLLELDVPPMFRASPWLRDCRAIVLDNGRCDIGGLRLHYAKVTGLRIYQSRTLGDSTIDE